MVTARFLRAAGACFTMCPFVVCGGEGDGRVLTRHTSSCSAWIGIPPSRGFVRDREPRSSSTSSPRRNSAASSITPSSSAGKPRPTASVRMSLSSSQTSSSSKLFRVTRDYRRCSTASLSTDAPPWLVGRRTVRGRGARGFQLGSVTAVRSPGDGAASTATTVGGEEELRGAFDAAAGEDGLLGVDGFRAIADVSDLLKDGLLQDSEILAIWKTVSKADAVRDRVDFRGFAKAFAQVDALFEEEEEVLDSSDGVAASSESGNRVDSEAAREAVVGEVGEAEASFRALVGSSQGMLDLAGLLRWSEVTELLEENLVTREEVEQMWEGLPKATNSVKAVGTPEAEKGTLINLEGFLEFDRQLSDLFEDEEPAANEEPAAPLATEAAPAVQVATKIDSEAVAEVEDDDTPEGQFAKLSAATGGLLTLDGLMGWSEVAELLKEDLLTAQEVESMFEGLRKPSDGSSSIDLAGFVEFKRQLDGLFEDDDDEEDSSPTAAVAATATTTSKQDLQRPREAESVVGETEAGGSAAAEAKARLVELAKGELADCGMGCGEDKRAKMMKAMEELLAFEEGNLAVREDLGTGLLSALLGEWRLLYTSSNAMEYNQGLTGLANTIPNAKFRGLRHILHADGMVFDAEYEEELSISDESEPLVITVTSDWEVKQTSSLVTGKSTVAVSVAPKQIKYGFITVRSERWKTLRAMMLLDIAYLDDDLRIMRGQTARQNFFVFVRV